MVLRLLIVAGQPRELSHPIVVNHPCDENDEQFL